jgi:hypothetical protein
VDFRFGTETQAKKACAKQIGCYYYWPRPFIDGAVHIYSHSTIDMSGARERGGGGNAATPVLGTFHEQTGFFFLEIDVTFEDSHYGSRHRRRSVSEAVSSTLILGRADATKASANTLTA